MQKKVKIFIDGSCLNNPGPGGYGIILRYKQYEKLFSAGYYLTTNNRMELMAAIVALESLTKPCQAIINTDSQYLRYGITTWIGQWKIHNWKKNDKKSVKNRDLWEKLDSILYLYTHKIEWNWIRSHNGHPENEHCDKLARNAANHPYLDDIGYLHSLSL